MAFEKYKPRGLFSEFYGIWLCLREPKKPMLIRGMAVILHNQRFVSSFAWAFIHLTLSLPNVAKGKFLPNFQISFSKILRNK